MYFPTNPKWSPDGEYILFIKQREFHSADFQFVLYSILDGTMRIIPVEVEWLDMKLDKESVDQIVTNPPRCTSFNEKKIKKVYNELFYQAALVLKPKGNVTLITTTPDIIEEQAKKHGFKVSKKSEIFQGKEKVFFLILRKGL